MCYAIPGKVIEVQGKKAVVDYFGEKRNVLVYLDQVAPGDFVYAQGGVLISKISEKDAQEILKIWQEKFFELKEVDQKLAQVQEKTKNQNLLTVLQKANLKQELTRQEMLYLLSLEKKEELKLFFETANQKRQKEHDNACCVHGILEFSNHCKNNCFYCGLRKDAEIERYRLSEEEIVQTAEHAVKELGFKALVLQSGEDDFFDEEKLIRIVQRLSQLGILIFLSIGEKPKETYQKLFEAGAKAALLRFETSNKELFEKLRPGTSWKKRIELIKDLKEMGFILATGFLVGLSGETKKDLLNNILLTKELQADMYSFGPLIPAPGTPLAKEKPVDKNLILKTIALTRLLDRQAKILVTTALETLDEKALEQGLMAGANSLMLNVTPWQCKKLYSIYPDQKRKQDNVQEEIKKTVDLLYSLGRAPVDLGV